MFLPIILITLLIAMMLFKSDAISWFFDVINPIIVAFVIAYLLDSIVKFFMNKFKLKRGYSILLAYICVLLLIALLFALLVPSLIENFNAVVSFLIDGNINIESMIEGLKGDSDNKIINELVDFIQNSSGNVQEEINKAVGYIASYVVGFVKSFGMGIFSTMTSFIISIYMLIEKDDIIARIKRFVFAYFEKRKANRFSYIVSMANTTFKSYLNGKILDAFIVGLITITLFTIFKVPYAPLMGSLIGLFNIIPYFGPIIGSVPVVIVSFFVEPSKALTALIIIIIVQQIDGNYIDPKIVSSNVGVSPFWVLAAVTVGGSVAGPVGMITGVPTLVLIKTLIEESVDLKLKEKDMGNFEKDKLIKTKIKKRKKRKSKK